MRSRSLLVALAVLLPGSDARADSPPPSLRKLCIHTPVIVLAAPLDPVAPTRFKVLSVLRGRDPTAGEVRAPAGLTLAAVQTFDHSESPTRKPRPRRISLALLFLNEGASAALVAGGLRLCTEEGQVLAPGGAKGALEVRPGLRWPQLLVRARADVAEVDRLLAYRRLARPQRRIGSLLDWVQRHRGDFGAIAVPGREDECPGGWEDLQVAVFDWALEGASPEDAWTVVKLYAEMNRGETPPLHGPTFSTTAGRAFLAGVAQNQRALTADRLRALHLLAERAVLWPADDECRRGAVAMAIPEQNLLLDALAALLPTKEEVFRSELVLALCCLSRPEGKALYARRTNRALPALLAAYRGAPPGPARDELSAAVCAMATPSQWKELSGNPPGVCVCLRDMEISNGTATFWLALQPGTAGVHEAPVLVLEKHGTLGFVTETKRLPLQVMNLERGWAAGWTGAEMLAVRQDLPGLAPGSTYRLRVEGFIGKGKDRQKWRSEPKRFQVPAPKQPSGYPPYPGRYYRKG
jgi:hypothetical protein